MKKNIILVFILSCFIAPAFADPIEVLERDLNWEEEVNSSFTYLGKPINPALIMQLSTRLHENHPPVVVTVDAVAGNDINVCSGDTKIEKVDGGWETSCRDYVYPEKEKEIMTDCFRFWYKWLGKLANGWHVLETSYNGCGSGFFMDVLFIKVSQGEIVYEESHSQQILLTVMRTDSLGDRYDGDIKVFPYKVVIPASRHPHVGGGSLEEETVISFKQPEKSSH